MNVTGDPGTGVPTARRALAVTTTLSGAGPAMRRTLTAAIPPLLVTTVSVVTSACAVSLVTRVTGPAMGGSVIANTTGRPSSGTVRESPPLAEAIVTASSTASESDSESGSVTVSAVAPLAENVSAAASVRTEIGFEVNSGDRATNRPI